LLGLLGLRIQPSSPLDIQYWSTTPYLFGAEQAVKYSLRPTSKRRSEKPDKPGEDYLAEAMQAHLAKQEASFDFCVQLQATGMPIEDASQRWDERRSPLVKVATLTIPVQKFRTAQRQELAERLSFAPDHALPDHAPLGGLNRARIKIYSALSKFRHKRDKRHSLG
ncbi:MAG: catalase, partial [Frankiaceae bacterium]|nr:catalase [Arenimonas sp.]